MRRAGILLALLFASAGAVAQESEPAADVAPGSRAAAAAALERLREASGTRPLTVLWDERGGPTPRRIDGLDWASERSEPEAAARAFLGAWPELFPVGEGELKLVREEKLRGRTAVSFRQQWRGLEVLESGVVVTVDEGGRVLAFSATAVAIETVEEGGEIGVAAAAIAAHRAVTGQELTLELATSLAGSGLVRRAIWPRGASPRLVYRVVVPVLPLLSKWVCVIDALSGEVIFKSDQVRR